MKLSSEGGVLRHSSIIFFKQLFISTINDIMGYSDISIIGLENRGILERLF